MRIRLVSTLKGGEKLAEPVITEEKETLISKGTILKPEYLDLISFLGIDTVCIEDPYESEEKPHHIIDREKREEYISEVRKILGKHIYRGKESLERIKPLADEIVEDILSADENIVIDMEERNGNLYEHTVEVTLLAVMVARKIGLERESLRQVALGCLLHDLGLRYITVPYINYEIEKSSAAEAFEYRKHTILAYSALEEEKWLDELPKRMVLLHHERKDGSGFPLKQKTREIECKILQVCDALDCAMCGMECKRSRIQQILEYLVEASDILYERSITKVIQRLVARYPVGTKVRLTTGETGIVIAQSDNSIRPVIRILDEENNLTKAVYELNKNKKINILQIEE